MAPRSLIYSKSPKAGAKRVIDQTLASARRSIDFNDENYLKGLIAFSKGRNSFVKSGVKGLQFFIIRGGAEGFLQPYQARIDASREMTGSGSTTAVSSGVSMIFDNVDLLAVFDKNGAMIAAAPLRRPLSITVTDKGKAKHIWTEHTANRVYEAWDGRPVTIYRNTNFDVAYYGLMVDDSLGMYRSGAVRIDIHKQEATNGCIFIVDDGTPRYVSNALGPLSHFEPALIQSVQKAIGHKTHAHIGVMNMVEIS
jgi:hypothetical protein